MVIIDGGNPPAAADGASILVWNSYGAEAPDASVPAYLEQHGDRLRARYLAFIHDLGEATIAGRRVVDHFRQADGFSFWWMTRIAEKSPFKSTGIFNCLRLLALEEMLLERGAQHVTLQSADRDLSEAVRRLCHGLGARFSWRRLSARPTREPTRLYDTLPHWLKGLMSFRHLLLRWPFRSLRPVKRAGGADAIFVSSYLFHLDAVAAERQEFHSHQWGMLPHWLHDHGRPTNWLHQFLPDGGRDVGTSVSLLRAFNTDSSRQGSHAVLETYLSPGALAAIVRDWLRHAVLGWRLRHINTLFIPSGSKAWLWPLLRDDWQISMTGTAAVTNCTCRALFDEALKNCPAQSRGLYLFEGQGWESSFVHAWRKNGHGEIIGVPHSSMPFWYLSIYDDARHYGAANEKPLPDRWALNGNHASREFTKAGLPNSRIAPVEALRFQYLAGATPRRPARAPNSGQPLRLLLLGDFTRGQTLRMMRCLETALPLATVEVKVAIKRHPVCPLDITDAGSMPCEFVEQPLGDVITRFDIAFASNTTSAAIDALLSGVPVIAFLDDAGFNQSPLRSVPHVRFVSRPAELAAAIDQLAGETVDTPVDDFFWVDNSLPRWSALVRGPRHAHV